MRYMTVVPAYGRDYPSKAKAVEAWNEGKDFTIQDMSWPDNGRAVSIRELPDGVTVNIRYKQTTMVAVVKPTIRRP